MEDNYALIFDDIKIEDATINELLLANIFDLVFNDLEPLYNLELEHISKHTFAEYEKIKAREDNIVKIIHGFKSLLKQQGKWYLANKWGINIEDITEDINKFELDFIEFWDNIEDKRIEELCHLLGIDPSTDNYEEDISNESKKKRKKKLDARKNVDQKRKG